jgi:hypothetical protein
MELLKIEQLFIDFEKPFFNICKIAGNSLGVIRSELSKKRMSDAKKLMTEETKQKIRKAITGIPSKQKGISLSRERKLHLSKINTGKHLSNETKKKCSDAMKAHIRTPEHCRNLSLAKKNQTLETRQKISLANKGKKRTPEQIEKNRQARWGK